MNPEKAETLSPELRTALQPLLAGVEMLSDQIREYNERIEDLAQESYPEVKLLKQVKGVGTLIALMFLLTLEDPHRSRKSRDVGCISDYSRGDGPPDKANRRCTSAKKAIHTCGPYWCKEHSTSSDRSVPIAICDVGA